MALSKPKSELQQKKIVNLFKRVTKHKRPRIKSVKCTRCLMPELRGIYSAIAARNGKGSPLLRLPLSVRNKIYGYVLGGKNYSVYVPKNRAVCMIEVGPDKPELQLLRVCSQAYSEAREMPFKINTFSVWPHVIERWLYALKPNQKKAIAALKVNYPEARNGISYLNSFPGLRTVLVCWTPSKHTDLDELAESIKEDADNPALNVSFRHFD